MYQQSFLNRDSFLNQAFLNRDSTVLDSSFEMWFWYRLKYQAKVLVSVLDPNQNNSFGRTLIDHGHSCCAVPPWWLSKWANQDETFLPFCVWKQKDPLYSKECAETYISRLLSLLILISMSAHTIQSWILALYVYYRMGIKEE